MVAKCLDLKKLSQWSCKYGRKNEKKIDMCAFSVHDCTREQNGSPYFSSIVQRVQMAISVKKDCWEPEICQAWQPDVAFFPLYEVWKILLKFDFVISL